MGSSLALYNAELASSGVAFQNGGYEPIDTGYFGGVGESRTILTDDIEYLEQYGGNGKIFYTIVNNYAPIRIKAPVPKFERVEDAMFVPIPEPAYAFSPILCTQKRVRQV